MYKHFFKRLLDIFISSIALLCIGWFILLVALFLHFANKGAGAFFLQERPGKDEKTFKIIKFKTMTDKRDNNGNLLPDKDRLTKVGGVVRKLSIDELPQLINVFKGDMSFVGPRPLLPRYLPWYTEQEKIRHFVRPGITGWAQIHGRNTISWDDKLSLDVYYVKHLSLWLDIRILFITAINVLRRKDIAVTPVSEFLDVERKRKQQK
jgi:lipopolysaccharide/colanic/teichoic acid biosynthesis glycosyltransferase